jgi:hypothetical protein
MKQTAKCSISHKLSNQILIKHSDYSVIKDFKLVSRRPTFTSKGPGAVTVTFDDADRTFGSGYTLHTCCYGDCKHDCCYRDFCEHVAMEITNLLLWGLWTCCYGDCEYVAMGIVIPLLRELWICCYGDCEHVAKGIVNMLLWGLWSCC